MRDLTYQQKGKKIVLTYDLIGEKGETYKINLILSANRGRVFDYQPESVTGAVGKGVKPGLDKRIVWDVLADKPGGLKGSNYQFKVTVEKTGGSGVLYVLGSMVLAGGGGTAASFFLKWCPVNIFPWCPASPDIPRPPGPP